jgi:nucleoside 2-deoxyribosyltransferase
MKVYLCGPINGCTDEAATNWREWVKARLPDTLDPMRRDYRGLEDLHVHEIVDGDKADIDRCDAVLVNYDRPSVGTAMEVLYAYERKRFVVVVARSDAAISPWMRRHAHVIVDSFADALTHLR